MLYLTNAFSLSMIPIKDEETIRIKQITLEDVKKLLSTSEWRSAIGHESTAHFLTQILEINVPFERVAIKLNRNDKVIVFQLLSRLPEGKVLSPEELKTIHYKFFLVEFV